MLPTRALVAAGPMLAVLAPNAAMLVVAAD